MKNKALKCPGCGKHCAQGCARCKYGVKYFAKQAEKADTAPASIGKWEKYVAREGTAWQLLYAAKRMKKALKDSGRREEQALSPLSADEQAALSALLQKLGA